MGNTDSLPVISQTKSAVQLIAGDTEGAKQTQKNFVKGCPVVSQVVATVALASGNSEFAKESQLYFIHGVSDFADAVPVLGHVKGAGHYAFGDREGGDKAMKAASRSVGVLGGGIAGCAACGPAGAAAGGVAGGAAMDGIISAVDSALHDEKRLYGHFHAVDQLRNNKMSAGEGFDWVVTFVFDGVAGYRGAKAVENFTAKRAAYAQMKSEIVEAVRQGKLELAGAESVDVIVREIQHVALQMKEAVKSGPEGLKGTKCAMVIDVEGTAYTGYSFRLRKAQRLDPFQGEEATTQRMLNEKFPNGAPKVRGSAGGEPSCAEQHALHEFHKARGNPRAAPCRMITIEYDGQQFRAVARCGNCKKVGQHIPMGDVVTDEINGAPVPLDDATKKAFFDALLVQILSVCDCDCDSENDEEGKDK
ncbi:hypothetical protein BOX15_Mlig033190g1 [Macrostomum lignano]|uniref:Uncharacterized protein n=1 Tax=Macrostomum lignano TaxID=282301 RepID=A0A267F534_9PLAT|nr:hypothetical protein BOX15_Mlig033190g1 [Macrostomum lignano]